MEFSRQEYWSGVPLPSPEKLSYTVTKKVTVSRERSISGVMLTGKINNSKQDGEGNGPPLQYSCLENPMDEGAWKAAVHGVAEGQT